MVSLICAALLLSIDSVLVSFALGACHVKRLQKNRLAVAFGVCDGVASLIGLLLGASLPNKLALLGHWGGPALVGAYAVIMLALAREGRIMAGSGSPRQGRMLYLLPLVMSLDNLAASFALVHAGPPLACAAVIGLVSGVGSMCGFRAGELASMVLRRVRGAMGIRWEGRYLDGIAMFSAAVLLAVC